MAISNIQDYAEKVQLALGDLQEQLEEDHVEFAIEQTMDELGWSFPIKEGTRPYWAVQRAKRHCLDILRTTAAYKFKYKQINLQQRFEQLHRQIYQLDFDFRTALKYDASLFDIDISDSFGTYLGNNIIMDQYGNDVTKLMNDIGDDNDGYRDAYINY